MHRQARDGVVADAIAPDVPCNLDSLMIPIGSEPRIHSGVVRAQLTAVVFLVAREAGDNAEQLDARVNAHDGTFSGIGHGERRKQQRDVTEHDGPALTTLSENDAERFSSTSPACTSREAVP